MLSYKRNLLTAIVSGWVLLSACAYAGAQGVVTQDPAQFIANHEPELDGANQARKFYLISNLAPAALAANQIDKARSYAEQLLAMGQAMQSQPGFGPSFYGNGTHVGNVVLGQIAYLNGDIKAAKEHLLEAGKVSGSPNLNSFGPDMLLAKELVAKGERETVLKYLDLCATFWKNDRGRLETWKQNINQGEEPNFGSNVGYVFDIWRFAK
jgi:hypothetical protein